MATVEISDVRKAFNAYEVIGGVTIDVQDGEFVALVGPSGCGKSTLLRMIAGLERIDSGEIRIDGKVVNNAAPKDRDIAMVFQSYALYPHKSVAENMAFSLRMRKTPKNEIQERVKRAAAILGLEQLLDRYPRELSGGQRQRVAMGRAIVRNPKVFLFDEPLSNLDAKLRIRMRTEIKGLHQSLKTTTIYVTHDQIEAMTMADKIVVMKDGAVQQIGSPLDLFDRPGNVFVASFIGSPSMNFIQGQIDGAAFISDGGFYLPLPDKVVRESGRDVLYGIRPEHLSFSESGIQAKVVVVEPMGSETQVVLNAGGHEIVALQRERLAHRPGDVVRVAPNPDFAHLFDVETSMRLKESTPAQPLRTFGSGLIRSVQ